MDLEEENKRLQLENENLWVLVNEKLPSAVLLKQLQYELQEAKSNYDSACGLVAQMHCAAVGCVQGPKRGVLEDVEDLVSERDRLKKILEHVSNALRRCGFPRYADKLLKELNNGT